MRIYLASDHAGFELKQQLVQNLKTWPHLEIEDLGPFDLESVDYPDYADKVCRKIGPRLDHLNLPATIGILICGSGQGMAIRANKYQNVRAALVYNEEITKLSREHNDANVLCLGSRFITLETALKIASIFIKTPFAQGRHLRRVVKVSQPT